MLTEEVQERAHVWRVCEDRKSKPSGQAQKRGFKTASGVHAKETIVESPIFPIILEGHWISMRLLHECDEDMLYTFTVTWK